MGIIKVLGLGSSDNKVTRIMDVILNILVLLILTWWFITNNFGVGPRYDITVNVDCEGNIIDHNFPKNFNLTPLENTIKQKLNIKDVT